MYSPSTMAALQHMRSLQSAAAADGSSSPAGAATADFAAGGGSVRHASMPAAQFFWQQPEQSHTALLASLLANAFPGEAGLVTALS